jgi:hypothetical protein
VFDENLPRAYFSLLPGVRLVTVEVRTGAGSPDAKGSFTCNARRRPATEEELRTANLTASHLIRTFCLLNEGQAGFVEPRESTVLTDSDGSKYTVKAVTAKILDTLYNCVCVKQWTGA